MAARSRTATVATTRCTSRLRAISALPPRFPTPHLRRGSAQARTQELAHWTWMRISAQAICVVAVAVHLSVPVPLTAARADQSCLGPARRQGQNRERASDGPNVTQPSPSPSRGAVGGVVQREMTRRIWRNCSRHTWKRCAVPG